MLVSSSHSLAHKAAVKPPLQVDPSLEEFRALVAPAPGEGDTVEVGRRSHQKPLTSIPEARQRAAALDFLPIDPYVASVGGAIGAERVEIPKGETVVEVTAPDYYGDKVEVLFGGHNGPGAPMMVILPGIHSSGESSQTNLFRKMALERGMNYVVVPNSLSEVMLEDAPRYHPGNPRVDALATHQLIGQLKAQMPEYFQQVSVGGYSYGALHGANLVRVDEEQDERLINGSLVAISPPENLDHSMRQLDGLRALYEEGAGSISQTGLKYRSEVKRHGYDGFLESDLSQRGEGSNITEIKMCDKYGSRDGLKKLIEVVDTQFGHNQLPRNTQEYKDAGWWQRHKLRDKHDQIVEDFTYEQFSQGWMSQDAWLREQGLTPAEMARRYSFGEAMKAIDETPVLTLVSADDYILGPEDVKTYRQLEKSTGELEILRVVERGGHVGINWNPKTQELISDFASGNFAS